MKSAITVTFKAALGRPRAAKADAAPKLPPAEAHARARAKARATFANRLQQRLALAHLIERKIESGEIRDYAEAARLLGVTRARMSQLLDLVLLPVDTQERILYGENLGSERVVRSRAAPTRRLRVIGDEG